MNKYGLIMEGGAMRGMFTAGVIDVLMEADFWWKLTFATEAVYTYSESSANGDRKSQDKMENFKEIQP
jgi:predicted patatin/cPLA2 family phospholipase